MAASINAILSVVGLDPSKNYSYLTVRRHFIHLPIYRALSTRAGVALPGQSRALTRSRSP